MSTEKKKKQEDLTIKDEISDSDFKGYSMEELRYQRALMALRKEFCKTKLQNSIEQLRHPFSKNENSRGGLVSKVGTAAGFMGKILTKMNLLDYAMIGMQLFGSGRKVYKFLKGSKKA